MELCQDSIKWRLLSLFSLSGKRLKYTCKMYVKLFTCFFVFGSWKSSSLQNRVEPHQCTDSNKSRSTLADRVPLLWRRYSNKSVQLIGLLTVPKYTVQIIFFCLFLLLNITCVVQIPKLIKHLWSGIRKQRLYIHQTTKRENIYRYISDGDTVKTGILTISPDMSKCIRR